MQLLLSLVSVNCIAFQICSVKIVIKLIIEIYVVLNCVFIYCTSVLSDIR